jgi:hypothetical protein
MRRPNSRLPEFGNFVGQVGNRRLGCAGPEYSLVDFLKRFGLSGVFSTSELALSPAGNHFGA